MKHCVTNIQKVESELLILDISNYLNNEITFVCHEFAREWVNGFSFFFSTGGMIKYSDVFMSIKSQGISPDK